MAAKSTKQSPVELSTADRLKISQARETLAHYGLDPHPESAHPMDDVSYEQRNCRMKALDVAVAAIATNHVTFPTIPAAANSFVGLADTIYVYIWEGRSNADDVR